MIQTLKIVLVPVEYFCLIVDCSNSYGDHYRVTAIFLNSYSLNMICIHRQKICFRKLLGYTG